MASVTPRSKLTNIDKKIIKDSRKSDLELAQELGVFVGLIKQYRGDLSQKQVENTYKEKYKDILSKLQRKLEWKSIAEKFTESEIEFFEEKYCELVTQFNSDIHPTEEMQIIQLIQMDILINRNMAGRKRITQIIEDLNAQIIHLQSLSTVDVDMVARLHDKMGSYYTTLSSMVEELNKYQQRHSALMKDLKATRDQRLDKIESNKRDYISLVKMLDDFDKRQAEEREMQIMRAAALKQKEKLSEYHQYVDGSVTQPILCADTIKDEDVVTEDDQNTIQSN